MRPTSLDEFIGQSKIIGENTLLRKLILNDELRSAVFWGPPGCGKTTLAEIIANITRAFFIQLSAVTSNVSEVRKALDQAKERLSIENKKTLLFIDEIHRFNKAQQDLLLPAVENGIVVLIGATTENPYFEINTPLISRLRLFRFESLSIDEIKQILINAITDKEKGLNAEKSIIDEDALEHFALISNGDARNALNALELAVSFIRDNKNYKKIDLKIAEESIQKQAVVYDKKGESHYDVISAFIKSMRASDSDGALRWLARMIYAGEDPKFIARRMIIFASEDIGNSDPNALVIAVSAANALEYVGLPEARLNLAQAAIYLASAPKDKSVIKRISKAMEEVENKPWKPVPPHLKNH
ncbi:MAG: replication-associated recombination protein A [Actinobacteria bacterium]|nr:replication-associated recombination protein A [Actinomycetota bacterium]